MKNTCDLPTELSMFPWYIANKKVPWLIKAGVHQHNYFILATDLVKSYYGSGDEEKIREEKNIYNPSIDISTNFEDFLVSFHAIISGNSSKNSYEVTSRSSSSLEFTIMAKLAIYPFRWTFKLDIVSSAAHHYILSQLLVGQLSLILNVFQIKYQRLYSQYSLTKSELLSKVGEAERLKFKEIYKDDEYEWDNCMRLALQNSESSITNFPEEEMLSFLYKHSVKHSPENTIKLSQKRIAPSSEKIKSSKIPKVKRDAIESIPKPHKIIDIDQEIAEAHRIAELNKRLENGKKKKSKKNDDFL